MDHRWSPILYAQISATYSEYFEKIGPILRTIAEDLSYYHDYATALYTKWDNVQKVEFIRSFLLRYVLTESSHFPTYMAIYSKSAQLSTEDSRTSREGIVVRNLHCGHSSLSLSHRIRL